MGLAEYLTSLSVTYPNIPYLYAAIGYSSQSLAHIAFKQITSIISPFQLLFFRAFTIFLLNLFFLRQANQTPYIKNSKVFASVLKRVCFSSTFAAIVHYCVKFLPVSTVASLSNVGPIFIFFIEALYYKKPLNKISLTFTIICFIGVLLILQPQYIFSHQNVSEIQNYEILSLMVIFAAFCFSMTMLYIHDTSKKISAIINLHYSYMSHMVLSSILSNFDNPIVKFQQVNIFMFFRFILLIFLALTTQYMIVMATTLKKPSYTMPFGYFGLVVGFIADIFYFNTSFNLLTIIGMILTSGGLLSKLFIEQQKQHGKSSEKKSIKNEQIEESEDFSEKSNRALQVQKL